MISQDLVLEEPIPLVPKDALDIIEIRNKAFEKVLSVAISATGAADWVDMQGKPYLQGSGAEKVARRFGIRWFDAEIQREDLEDESGKYYIYTVMGKSSFGDREIIEAIGTCSSRDKFFGREGGKLKKIQDVDLPNIKKKAYTNFIVNAVTRLLGLRNLTWEELEKFGIRKSGKTAVRFATKTETPTSTKTSEIKSPSKPYWTFDDEKSGKVFLFAKVGKHFSEEFLTSNGFKETSKKNGNYYTESTEKLYDILAKQCQDFERGAK